MLSLSLMALAAAIAGLSSPDGGRNFGSWQSVCDNGHLCQVSSAMGDPANIGVHLHVRREAGPSGAIEIGASSSDGWGQGPVLLLIDGRRFPLVARESLRVVPEGSAMTAARALAQARSIEVVAGGGRHSVRARGSAAALRDMDARQGRAGTITAIVATGRRAAASVPPAPPLPVRTERIAPRAGLVIRPPAQRTARWRREEDCSPDLDPADYPTQSWPLDSRHAVILVMCHPGSRNSAVLVKVGTRADGSDARDARFDFPHSMIEGPGGRPDNAERHPDNGRLVSGQRGAIAYPSVDEEWVWDGERFRLIERTGSYGSSFRARVRRR